MGVLPMKAWTIQQLIGDVWQVVDQYIDRTHAEEDLAGIELHEGGHYRLLSPRGDEIRQRRHQPDKATAKK
jgi:hypothetical protein